MLLRQRLKDVPAQSTAPPVLSLEDQVKHYQEGRTDVRSYAGFLIQVITLLLTTMILVMGWVAKDYATEKYRVALRATAPHLSAPSSPSEANSDERPIYNLPVEPAGKVMEEQVRELEQVSKMYWHLMLNSPTTSILLAGFSGFIMIVLGLLIAITYQLQRRRYHYHALGIKLGLESDQPVQDAVLIGGALNELMVIVGLAASALILTSIIQTVRYVYYTDIWTVKFGLSFLLLLILSKVAIVIQMVANYTHFERTEGWKARWSRASRIAERLESKVLKSPNRTQEITKTVREISATCSTGGKPRWERAGLHICNLNQQLASDESLKADVSDELWALAITLRHHKTLRRTERSKFTGWKVVFSNLVNANRQ